MYLRAYVYTTDKPLHLRGSLDWDVAELRLWGLWEGSKYEVSHAHVRHACAQYADVRTRAHTAIVPRISMDCVGRGKIQQTCCVACECVGFTVQENGKFKNLKQKSNFCIRQDRTLLHPSIADLFHKSCIPP